MKSCNAFFFIALAALASVALAGPHDLKKKSAAVDAARALAAQRIWNYNSDWDYNSEQFTVLPHPIYTPADCSAEDARAVMILREYFKLPIELHQDDPWVPELLAREPHATIRLCLRMLPDVTKDTDHKELFSATLTDGSIIKCSETQQLRFYPSKPDEGKPISYRFYVLLKEECERRHTEATVARAAAPTEPK